MKKDLPELCKANFRAFMDCKLGALDMRKRMRGNAPLSTGKYDAQYEKLSSGNFDPEEEIRRLDVMNRNLTKQQQLQEEKEKARLEGGS